MLANDSAGPDTGETLALVSGFLTAPRTARRSRRDGRAERNAVYMPDPDYTGLDSFTYQASDGRGGLVTATVFVAVATVDDPRWPSDAVTLDEDTVAVVDVLANDSTGPDGWDPHDRRGVGDHAGQRAGRDGTGAEPPTWSSTCRT